MVKEMAERIFTRQRWTDITTAKAVVMWALLLVGEVVAFPHERVMGVAWVLTCLTTTAMVLLRIEGSNDAWRRGYRAALSDTEPVEEDQAARVLPFRG